MGVRLIYKDITPGADTDAAVSTSTAEALADASLLPFGVPSAAVATLEPNGWGLTQDYKTYNGQAVAFWSKDISGADCSFATPPTITVTFSERRTTTGLSVMFSRASGDYCAQISVAWYQGATLLASETYAPTSTLFVARKTVNGFDKLVFTFERTSLPNRRVKVEEILFGIVREFTARELTGASFMHEISLISDTIPVNVMDAAICSASDADMLFQSKQPFEGYNGETLIGTYYVDTGKRTGSSTFDVSCHDIIGVWDTDETAGGIWFEDTPLTDILAEVFGDISVFDIAEEYAASTLRGYVPAGTKRAALQHIAFALGAVVDTAGTAKVRIFPAPTGTGAAIPAARTFSGGSIETAAKVTEVTVTAYVIFDERPGDNDESVEHNGVKYRYYTDTKHAHNPDVISSDPENKVKYIGAYLVNLSNAQALADNLMAYHRRREKYAFAHVLDGQAPGDRVSAALPWGGTAQGNITKMTISVSGIAVSDGEMLLDR